ncbi:MAG: DUF4230 domain-containing protein [Chloroherpetonaceae bacterium]|nr:DUF4230 domain-containing protein [Chloroherpetonaceae bacterium]
MTLTTRITLLIAAVAFAALAIAGAVYVVFVKVPTDLAEKVASSVRHTLHFTPEVRLNETIVVQQSTPILELATVSKEILVEDAYTHTFLGSTKTLVVRGTFVAKAGFDLREKFLLTVKTNPTKLIAELPAPKLLSIEMTRYDIVQEESGWWNRLTSEEREAAVQRLRQKAEQHLLVSSLLNDAETLMRKQLEAALYVHHTPLDISIRRKHSDSVP